MVADLRHPPLRTFVFILSWPLGTQHRFPPTLTPTAAVISQILLFESEFVFITFAATMAPTMPRFPGWWKPWSTHPALGFVACWETQYRKCGEKLLHSCNMLLLFFSLHILYMQTLAVECPSACLKFLAEISEMCISAVTYFFLYKLHSNSV